MWSVSSDVENVILGGVLEKRVVGDGREQQRGRIGKSSLVRCCKGASKYLSARGLKIQVDSPAAGGDEMPVCCLRMVSLLKESNGKTELNALQQVYG